MNIKNIKKAFGTYEIAKICQVTPPTVGRWIQEKILPSFTTGGGHRRVWIHDLADFLRAHNMPLPPDLFGPLPLKILIVDDDASIRKMVTRILNDFFSNVSVLEAKDGFEAGHMATLHLPSLVILDLMLPGMDGIQVCQMIKGNHTLKGIKVMAITGDFNETTLTQSTAAGADVFLSKPFAPEVMANEILKLFPHEIRKKEGVKTPGNP